MISLQKNKSIKLESCHQGVQTDLDELMNFFPVLLSPFAQYDKDLCFGCEVPTRQLIKQKKIYMPIKYSYDDNSIQAINFFLRY